MMKRSREPEDLELGVELSSTQATTPVVFEPTSLRPPVAKLADLDLSVVLDDQEKVIMRCSLPPHRVSMTFHSYGDYETHYNKNHTNRCLECTKNFPSNHFLDLHIQECHDPILAVKRERGERTFSCFVEGCDRQCSTHQKRRMHLIDKHMYPKNYFFAITKAGIDGRQSLLVNNNTHARRRSSTSASASITAKEDRERQGTPHLTKTRNEITEKSDSPYGGSNDVGQVTETARRHAPVAVSSPDKSADIEVDDLTGAMSALQFIPRSIRFGRGKGKAGFAKR